MIIKIMKKYILTIVILWLLSLSIQGQEWTRTLDGPSVLSVSWTSAIYDGQDVTETNDGGYVIAGIQSYATGAIRDYPALVKVDANGFNVWEKSYFSDNANVAAFRSLALKEMPNGNLLLGGLNGNEIILIQTNAVGDTLWTKSYDSHCSQTGGPCTVDGFSLEATFDGNYILAIRSHITLGAPLDLYHTQLIKVDPNGTVLWIKTHADAWAEAIQPTFDGGYILAGQENGVSMLYKLDQNGDSTWLNTYPSQPTSSWHSVVQAPDSGYVIATELLGFVGPSPLLIKVDKTGANMLWSTYALSNTLGGLTGAAKHVNYDNNGYYVVTGYTNLVQPSIGNALDIAFLGKVGLGGTVLVEEVFDIHTANQGQVVRPTSDNGYIIVGEYDNQQAYLVKTDSILNRPMHQFQGYVYKDNNVDCLKDVGEMGCSNWLIEIKKRNGSTVYATTDSTGYYEVLVDTGAFTIKAHLPNTLWGLCVDSFLVTSSQLSNTDTLNFGATGLVNCPLLNVDVSTSLLRRCSTAVYTVSYCNNGTADALGASVTVDLDTSLAFLGSSLPWSGLTGTSHVYLFNIGTVAPGACGSFTISVAVSCYAQLGQTHCVQANILPDSLCGNSSPLWDESDIDINGICYGDSIVYTIRNIGTGGMSGVRHYFVTEDHVILSVRPFNLGAGASTTEVVYTRNGAVYRLEAEQDVHHPHSTYTALGVLQCAGGNFTANSSLGILGQFVEDDGSPAVSIDCQENVGSWDPNDKQARPIGYGATHAIEANVDLEYHIRFQNTGTDTAFTVVIFDTLSTALDPSSVIPGASSHAYTWELKGNGILVFTFDNILLPDSIVNESASHGYVKFKIKQQPNLPLGTVLNNTAAIVFDMNAPVLTNTTFHTIEEDFILDIVKIGNRPETRIEAYPNPFQDFVKIVVKGETFSVLEVRLVDAVGRVVQVQEVEFQDAIILQGQHLETGLYFFQLIGDGELIGTGKLMAE
ncbi:MAG: Unknown protein [uncultured Aureispira sp.]|uniref:Uncharacterized protein n=1 Tax=uncultured Aureispira sp. TaxID=1331704 RepID=A0A6S6TLV8_9BACT|nr:MAG: Unknown protein [uncultured Aureispira sp.]